MKEGVGLKSEENVEDPNFLKRYKWALKPHHPAIHIQDVLVPSERDFINDCRAIQVRDVIDFVSSLSYSLVGGGITSYG